jgi:ribosome assembly protein YihI (activator of Der GTPase)
MRGREAQSLKNLRVIHEEKFDCLARQSLRGGARARRRTRALDGARRGSRDARGEQTNIRTGANDLLARCAMRRLA